MQRAPVICSYSLVVGFWKTCCSAKYPTCLHIFAKSILPNFKVHIHFASLHIGKLSSLHCEVAPTPHCQCYIANLSSPLHCPKLKIFTGCPNAWNVFLFCPSVCPSTKDCPIFSGCQILEKGFKTNTCLWMNGWTSVNETSWSLKIK